MKNSIGNAGKKSKKTGKNDKTKIDAGICWDKMEKATQEKITIQLEEINQKVLTKEGRVKRYREGVKQYRQNRKFQNNERKFYQKVWGDDTKIYHQPNAREPEQFWDKTWQPREHKKKAEWISNKREELEGLEEGPKAKIHIDSLGTTIKNISNWPWWYTFWFKKFTSIHKWLAIEMNRILEEADVPEWMTKERTILIQKDSLKGTVSNNYKAIMCFPMMWKILIAQKRKRFTTHKKAADSPPKNRTWSC